MNKRAVFFLDCFSPFQHLFLFLIRICVALFNNCIFSFALSLSTNAPNINRGLRGRDCLVVWFTTTCEFSEYHHYICEFESRSWRGVLDATLCDKVCQWLATGRWFSTGTPVSFINETDRHDITEILLKMALNTINQPTNRPIINKNIDPSHHKSPNMKMTKEYGTWTEMWQD
jgi:hypothetical protein